MSKSRECSECAAGENYGEPADLKIRHPHPDRPNLRVTKLVCDGHYTMLCDDYGDEVEVLEDYRKK